MTQITIKGFADQIGIPPETLMRQLDAAGIAAKSADDALSEDEKAKLFHYLRASHGAADEVAAKKKITLRRKSTSQVVQSTRTGATRTVQVEVRKKRTFIKRAAVEETPSPAEEAPAEELVEEAAPAAITAQAPAQEPVTAEAVPAPVAEIPAAAKVAPPASVVKPAAKPAPAPAKEVKKPHKGKKERLEKLEERERGELHLAAGKKVRRKVRIVAHKPVVTSATGQHGFERPTAPIEIG